MRVLCFSVEKGIVLGVAFTPAIHNGCWVGEAEITDPKKLELMGMLPQFSTDFPGPVAEMTPAVIQQQLVIVGPRPNPGQGQGKAPEGKTPAPVPLPVTTIGGLPGDLPGRVHLERAGIDSVEDIKAMSDEQLIAVEGVGPKTLKDIRVRLSE